MSLYRIKLLRSKNINYNIKDILQFKNILKGSVWEGMDVGGGGSCSGV
jgi:hypothetical protein